MGMVIDDIMLSAPIQAKLLDLWTILQSLFYLLKFINFLLPLVSDFFHVHMYMDKAKSVPRASYAIQ